MYFQIRIAGKTIGIQCLREWTYKMCTGYICESNEVDINIEITQADIEFEQSRVLITNTYYSVDYLESLAIYRKIAERLIEDDILLFHGTVIGIGNKAYMISAASGVGKTTFSDLWLESIQGAYILNGDKPLVHISDQENLVYGTPWSGKERRNTNGSAVLKHICFIERGEYNGISEISFGNAIPFLLTQVYTPESAESKKKTIKMLSTLVHTTKFYRMSLKYYQKLSDMDNNAALLAYHYMCDHE